MRRTCLARSVNLKERTDMTVAMPARAGRVERPAAREELLEVYGLFASEYDTGPSTWGRCLTAASPWTMPSEFPSGCC